MNINCIVCLLWLQPPSTYPDESSQHFLLNSSDWQPLTRGVSNCVESLGAHLRGTIRQSPAQRRALTEVNTVTKVQEKTQPIHASVTDGKSSVTRIQQVISTWTVKIYRKRQYISTYAYSRWVYLPKKFSVPQQLSKKSLHHWKCQLFHL